MALFTLQLHGKNWSRKNVLQRFLKTAAISFACILLILSMGACSTGNFETAPLQEKLYSHEVADAPILLDKVPKQMPSVVIIPHHLIAGKQIAQSLKTIAATEQSPKRIILMGPNHYFRGIAGVITSDHAWETNYGTIESDRDFIATMVEKNFAADEEGILENDHAITALLPFLEKFWPNAKLVSLLVREPMPEKNARVLGDFFAQQLDKDTIIIASIDFSHYLPKFVADIHDEATLAALRNLDFDFFKNNIDADSPQILMVLAHYLQNIGHETFTLLDHTNSATLAGTPYEPLTTSHILGYFSEGPVQKVSHLEVLFGPSSQLPNPLYYKGGDFVFFANQEKTEQGTPSRIFEKNGIRASIQSIGSDTFTIAVDGSTYRWNLKDGPAALLVSKENEAQSDLRFCFFNNQECI